MPTPHIRLLALAALLPLLLTACSRQATETPAPTPSAQQKSAQRAAVVAPSIQKHWTYLNRIRQTDELSPVIARTLLNERDQLGVVFYSRISDDKIPDQIRQIMTEMAKKFPKEAITVVAYGASTPPHPIGIAQIDGATGEISFTPSK
ncbi:MAG: hypothetical protein ABIR38_08325 [Chthoniobacterales bacterium]